MSNRTLPARLMGALAIAGMSSFASAATLVDYKPLPLSPTTPEFVFDGPAGAPSFKAGPGATGNADGTLPLVSQTPGGLEAEAPFIIPGIPGSQITTSSTIFFDATLELGGLVANAPAVTSGPLLIQSLGTGTFSLSSTDPDGAGPMLPTLLLSGNIATSSFIVGTGDAGATFNSFGLTYTGGAIYAAMLAAGGSSSANSMSISMTDVNPSFSIAGSGFLSNFTANATGLFNYTVPEPTSLAAVAGLAGAIVVRRRARQG